MEKGCILPISEFKRIDNPEHIVISQLARFCKSSSNEILEALQVRNTEETQIDRKKYWYGYKKHPKKSGSKTRIIRAAYPTLQSIQSEIQKKLMTVPVSFASTAAKAGDSATKNAEIHRANPYLITLDIKNAYPSIDTHRVYTNFDKVIRRNLDIWCPLLENSEDKKTFIRALTHLCMSENELPQGASTSNQIQNIVLTATDVAIEKILPNMIGYNVQYSRYADDITVSFPYMQTMNVLHEQCNEYITQLQSIQNNEQTTTLDAIIDQFSKDTFIITDNYELQYLQESIQSIKKILQTIDTDTVTNQDRYRMIGIVNKYKTQIRRSDRSIDVVKEKIIEVIGKQGRKINLLKTRTRTPQSNNDREINGMAFDHTGKRKLGKKKKMAYMKFFSELHEKTLEELRTNYYYRREFGPKDHRGYVNIADKDIQKAIAQRIINKLGGMRGYLVHIYEGEDNITKDISNLYNKAYEKRSNTDTENRTTPDTRPLQEDDDLPF